LGLTGPQSHYGIPVLRHRVAIPFRGWGLPGERKEKAMNKPDKSRNSLSGLGLTGHETSWKEDLTEALKSQFPFGVGAYRAGVQDQNVVVHEWKSQFPFGVGAYRARTLMKYALKHIACRNSLSGLGLTGLANPPSNTNSGWECRNSLSGLGLTGLRTALAGTPPHKAVAIPFRGWGLPGHDESP